MLFGRKKRGHACMRCGNGKKIDGDEMICSSCIDDLNLLSVASPAASGSDEENFEPQLKIANRASA